MRAIRAQAQDLKNRTDTGAAAKPLHEAAEGLAKRAELLRSDLYNANAEVGYDVLAGRDNNGVKLYPQLSNLYAEVEASDRAPTQGQSQVMAEDLVELKKIEDELSELRNGELARLEEQAKALGAPRIILPPRGT